MKAVYVKEFGGAENLEIREVENPSKPKEKEVLIRVKTSALNRADILQREGHYPAPKGFPEKILGLEFAGEVAEIGETVTSFKVGDRVFGITAGGAQAEFLLTDESLLARIPDILNFTEAATIPEAFITAHDAIFTQGNLREGETLLVHAIGSGVGLAALQLAKAKNIKTFGTSRTADKLEKCNEFGLDFGIVTTSESIEENPNAFAEIVRYKNDGKGVDVILDLVGAKYFAANLESLNLKGRLILVGLTSGRTAEFNLGMALAKRVKIIGTVLRTRSTEEKAEATQTFVRDVLPLVAEGKIKPNSDRVFQVEDIRKAHEYLESNASFGKVVLEF
ncbi:MAG: NAD(P)H-quinone oxidoreductase [Acidobacteria bacterium]|nr:NAD(P)H-quinone oxidoreductase [Acidobacteriota bacterium]MBA4185441.1 NAD(P)H-quinone oxidoreductase [Acidobacteriota bacterium]